MSQNQQILEMLKAGPVTPMDALKKAGTLRLAARINDLKAQGHQIITQIVRKRGKKFASYTLLREAE